ncbi:MAG: recombinase family protein, partial [Candidatus Faecousia sp.]|nr:recombinase family protein [Candidatus Faecousia sp.]
MERTIQVVQPMKLAERKLLRVAAYARVSCDKDAMRHSLQAQVDYYKKMITDNPDWSFAGVYPDAYYTGTRDDRPQFVQLIKDCKDGKIDRVITKTISRFARNTVTL